MLSCEGAASWCDSVGTSALQNFRIFSLFSTNFQLPYTDFGS